VKTSGTEKLGDRWLAAEPVYLSDLDKCQPQDSLSTEARRGHWRLLEYEADALSGVMLVAGTLTGAPEVRYPLRFSGWHAISIGVFGGYYPPGQLLVRLSSDYTFSMLTLPDHETTAWYRQYHGEHLWELYWKMADLTDRELVLGQVTWRTGPGNGPGDFSSTETMIAYIKVVPMSEQKVVAYQADLARQDIRRLFTHNDAGIHSQCPTTEEEIRRHVERYRDTDFSRIYWEAGMGDRLNYFGQTGKVAPHSSPEGFTRQHDRITDQSWRILRQKGIDPFRVALDHAHEIGLEFHAGYRVSGFHFPPPYDHYDQGPSFYRDHPELRGRDRSGNPTPRIAYTYQETRRYVISLLVEIADYPVDGVCLQYNRRLPLVEYEPSLLEGFRAEYGEDPRQLDERDARWLKYRARVLTQFMREVREAMDAVAETQGRTQRIEVSAIVTNSEQENLSYGLDLRAWVDEGLVDTLIPYSSHPNFNSNDDAWIDLRDVEFFVSLTENTRCKLALNIMPRNMSAKAYRERAAQLYRAGIENLFFWDGGMERAQRTGASHVMRRLGHRDEIEAWSRAGEPSLEAPSMRLHKLGGWDYSYVSPG
jgi:hypothetical protein